LHVGATGHGAFATLVVERFPIRAHARAPISWAGCMHLVTARLFFSLDVCGVYTHTGRVHARTRGASHRVHESPVDSNAETSTL
jgi:hypothetical protein